VACRRRRAGAPVCCDDSFGRADRAAHPAFAAVRRAGTRASRSLILRRPAPPVNEKPLAALVRR
jgi:hypothetical protein